MGIPRARILKWVAMPSSKESSLPSDWTHISYVSCIGRWVLYHQCHLASPIATVGILLPNKHERECSSGCMPTSTARFYFGVSKLTKGVWCYINEAAFLEARFPREGRDINKENKFFLSEKFGAYNCNNYPKLTCLGASIMQSWSLFTGTILHDCCELDWHTHLYIH